MPVTTAADIAAQIDELQIRITAAYRAAGYSTEDVNADLPELNALRAERKELYRQWQAALAREQGASDGRISVPSFS